MFKRSCIKGTFSRLLGEDSVQKSSSSLIKVKNDENGEEVVDFLVTKLKQGNYQKYCSEFQPLESFESTKIINQYTDHISELYAKVNLSLASDSQELQKYGEYISKLRNSIFSTPLYDHGLLYRGVELSDIEINEMESLQSFYIPSFTSTSVDSNKAYSKSSTMIIKVPFASKYACSITESLSKHYNDEKEVLLACYSAFRLERVEYVNNKKFVSLYLDEHLSALPSLDIIHYHNFSY